MSQPPTELSSQHFLQPTSSLMPSSSAGLQWEQPQALPSIGTDDVQPRPAPAAVKKLSQVLNVQKSTDSVALAVEDAFTAFLLTFLKDGQAIYFDRIRQMEETNRTTLVVSHRDMLNHDENLANSILEEYTRFEPFLKRSVAAAVQRIIPAYLTFNNQVRDFYVAFSDLRTESCSIRELRAADVGKLVTVKGTVTRTSIVRPELVSATFRCIECQQIYTDVEQQNMYTTPTQCMNPLCNNTSDWDLITERSKFVDWQKVRIQENANEIPPGSMPRSIDVIVRHEMCEVPKPGDQCLFTGMVSALPDVAQLLMSGRHIDVQKISKESGRSNRDNGTGGSGVSGLKDLGCREMSYKMAFIAGNVQTSQDKYGHFYDDLDSDDATRSDRIARLLTEDQRREMLEMIDSPTNYQDLISSIAPSVYGHNRVKEGLLLLLLGGLQKTTPEGTNKLRGDINVCIVGDPGLSKSQFLKYVASFLPRGVYTSGKASSAAGLTASVVKDDETGDFTIEAGALMLADNGICCIDEFDKMDVKDQVAIHEAMEQQTISIAKAGIHATLNARTSILAAANPINGRYDKSKSLKQNVNMSPPIMSRFDLFFVVVDRVNEAEDFQLAKHILNVHRDLDAAITPKYSTDMLRRFILFARALRPKLTPEAAKTLVDVYQAFRQSNGRAFGRQGYNVTVRQLESLIRLSEAMARAHADSEVTENYVKAAAHLLRNSRVQVEKEDVQIFEEDEAPVAAEVDKDGDQEMDDAAESQPVNPKSNFIPYEELMMIRRWVISLLSKRDAEQNIENDDDGESESSGLKLAELCELYLTSIENTLESEEDYEQAYRKIHRVLKYFVRRDMCLLPINAQADDQGMSVLTDDTVLVLHPSINDDAEIFL